MAYEGSLNILLPQAGILFLLSDPNLAILALILRGNQRAVKHLAYES